jgi:hypothetical protein
MSPVGRATVLFTVTHASAAYPKYPSICGQFCRQTAAGGGVHGWNSLLVQGDKAERIMQDFNAQTAEAAEKERNHSFIAAFSASLL